MQHICPTCESGENVTEKIEVDTFVYGAGEAATTLQASVPVMTCSKCEEAWTDYRAEEIKDTMVKVLFYRNT